MAALTKVFGHKSPDTDTTCSAIIWAWYLNTHTTTKAAPFVLGELNKETAFVLNRWDVEQPALLELSAEDDVVIVDTNNPQELPENINDANILAIIDHHKLTGGLSSKVPPTVTMRPLASTAALLYDLMGDVAQQSLPEDIAGLILSCILSDTLQFRSPTTTPHDKDVAETLAKKLGVEISEYANEMFAAKSDVSDYTDIGLVHLDSKKYPVGDKNLRISVIETTTPSSVLARKDGLIAAIQKLVAEEADTDDVLFFIVDIFKEEATVLTYNELTKKVIEASFGVSVSGDTAVLPGVVSRKKQVLPALKI